LLPSSAATFFFLFFRLRGVHRFEPYRSGNAGEPRAPFSANDSDDVGEAPASWARPALDRGVPQLGRLAQSVLHGGAAYAGQRRDRVEHQITDPAPLDLARHDTERSPLAFGVVPPQLVRQGA
jgi:hypothetical protein